MVPQAVLRAQMSLCAFRPVLSVSDCKDTVVTIILNQKTKRKRKFQGCKGLTEHKGQIQCAYGQPFLGSASLEQLRCEAQFFSLEQLVRTVRTAFGYQELHPNFQTHFALLRVPGCVFLLNMDCFKISFCNFSSVTWSELRKNLFWFYNLQY